MNYFDLGDDGVVLDSLYKFFQFARKTLSETQPRPAADGYTVESYVILVLNRDLRPFLSKWHPLWDAWHKANPDKPSSEWHCRGEFRKDLRDIQPKARKIAVGLAEIAGFENAEKRLFGECLDSPPGDIRRSSHSMSNGSPMKMSRAYKMRSL